MVTLRWNPLTAPDLNQHSATILTNDAQQPEIVLTVSGRVAVTVRPSPAKLSFEKVLVGETVSAEARLWCYLDEPLKIVGHEWDDPAVAPYFDVASEPIAAEELKQQPQARNGVLVRVTTKPGLPAGQFKHNLALQTNLTALPKVTLPIEGTVNSEVAVVSQGWNPETGTLHLGAVDRQTGMRTRVMLMARGPHRKEITFNVAGVTPDVIKTTLGQPTEINNGVVVQTPLTIVIPPGCPAMNYLLPTPDHTAEIRLETSHSQEATLKIRLNFAITE